MKRLKIILLGSVVLFLSFVVSTSYAVWTERDPKDPLVVNGVFFPSQEGNIIDVVQIGGKEYLRCSLGELSFEDKISSLLWAGYVGGYTVDKDGRWLKITGSEYIPYKDLPEDKKNFGSSFLSIFRASWRYIEVEFNGEKDYPNVVDCKAIYTEILEPDLPQWERNIINQVAREKELFGTARLLLYVIRKIENGAPGREFGVLSEPASTFLEQARGAAERINSYFGGNLQGFAAKYAPEGAANDPEKKNEHWLANANYYMALWSGSLYAGKI